MGLLGDDGRGYELARKLESHGVWRSWLGDALYSAFIPSLSSPATWDSFIRSDDYKTKPQIYLQLRVRALLFDKAAVSLFIQPSLSSPVSKLSANYLELHGDDVYFILENGAEDGDQREQGLTASNNKSFKGHSKKSIVSEFPETWYNQFFAEYRTSKSYYRLMFGDREPDKRTPEQMASYLKIADNNKRRRLPFKDDITNDDTPLFPESMFALNCVPDSAVLRTKTPENDQKVQFFNGVLDNLPQITTKTPVISPIMIERLGIRPEYLNMEQGYQSRGSKKLFCREQALKMSEKVSARLLTNLGFDSCSDTSLEVVGQCLSSHIGKLGRILKLLADSYRQQYSATELVKMFLQMTGYSNLGPLVELMKDNTKNVVQKTQQQVLGMQPHQQPSVQQSPQILRQMNPQMNNNPQYLQQHQWERMRKRQQLTMNTNMNTNNIDKDGPPVQVKMENPSDFPVDNANAFSSMNARQHLQELRQQQQLAAMSSLNASANNNSNAFRTPMTTSLHIPQILSPNMMTMARAQPVKVEGFQELMGGDSSMKHDLEENKLLSPQK